MHQAMTAVNAQPHNGAQQSAFFLERHILQLFIPMEIVTVSHHGRPVNVASGKEKLLMRLSIFCSYLDRTLEPGKTWSTVPSDDGEALRAFRCGYNGAGASVTVALAEGITSKRDNAATVGAGGCGEQFFGYLTSIRLASAPNRRGWHGRVELADCANEWEMRRKRSNNAGVLGVASRDGSHGDSARRARMVRRIIREP